MMTDKRVNSCRRSHKPDFSDRVNAPSKITVNIGVSGLGALPQTPALIAARLDLQNTFWPDFAP